MVSDFDQFAFYITDSDLGSVEKHLTKVSSDKLKFLTNPLGQNLLFIAIAVDKVKILDYLLK